MDAFLIGSLFGRLLTSVLIVYLMLLAFNRFDFRQAGWRLRGIVPIMSVLLVFIFGIVGSMLQS